MSTMNVYAIGASRNIGYYASLRLMNKGATVTFLLRNPDAFKEDAAIQTFVASGHARLVKGDGTNSENVASGWETAGQGGRHIDVVMFTMGASSANFSLIKGALISPPDLCTRALLNVLRTMPVSSPPLSSEKTKLIAVTSTGVTRDSHRHLPLLYKPFYSWALAQPHVDKRGMERVLAKTAGKAWDDKDSVSPEVLGAGWDEGLAGRGESVEVLVVRPAMLTDGVCRADVPVKGKKAYRAAEDEAMGGNNGWTVSRRDVAHFIVEDALAGWESWKGRVVSIAY